MSVTIVDRQRIYDGVVIRVERQLRRLANGNDYTLDLVLHPGAAAVVAVDDAGQVVLVRQYRHAAGEALWEIPAGLRDAGEDLLACAKRELEEETGVVAQRWRALGDIYTSPGFCSERIALYLAQDLHVTQQALDADEDLEVRRVPLAEAVAMAAGGALQDAKTALALLRAASVVGTRQPAAAPSPA